MPARRHVERREVAGSKVGISVGRSGGVQVQPSGVQSNQFVLKFFPRGPLPAPHAADKIEAAMEVNHPFVSGGLMKPVYILGQDELRPTYRFQPGQGAMGVVGEGPTETAPADHTPRPIAPARRLVSHERLVCHGLLALPVPIGIAIVRNTGIGAAAGPCEDEQPSMPFDEILK